MTSATLVQSESKALVWTGRVLSALPILLMLMGFVFSLVKPDEVKKGMSQLGYPESTATGIVILEMVCVVLYAIPQTAVLGAILMTAYLGGATASHVRAGQPFIMPVVVGVVVWVGILLRDRRLWSLIPLRKL